MAKDRSGADNIVFIGNKPVMNYVMAALQLHMQGNETVILKARGRAISHAVDVAEITRNRFLMEFEVKNIEIGTEVVENENRKSNVSAITITLGKKS